MKLVSDFFVNRILTIERQLLCPVVLPQTTWLVVTNHCIEKRTAEDYFMNCLLALSGLIPFMSSLATVFSAYLNRSMVSY